MHVRVKASVSLGGSLSSIRPGDVGVSGWSYLPNMEG